MKDVDSFPLIIVFISHKNTSSRLAKTLQSIKEQDYSRYRVYLIDSCSSDGVDLVISKYKDILYHVVEDHECGFYAGLSYLMGQCREGDLFCYINAGDLYMQYAFSKAAAAYAHGLHWISGLPSTRNANYELIRVEYPLPYSRLFIRYGLYNGRVLPAIQQESCFWSRVLQEKICLERLSQFRLAGDSYLWSIFSRSSDLTLLDAVIAGFTLHGHHLSSDSSEYRREQSSVSCRTRLYPIVYLTAIVYGMIQRFIRIPARQYKAMFIRSN